MARTFLTNIDLNQNELLNATIQNLATAPANPVEGQIYCNTTTHTFHIYLDGAWSSFVPSALLGVNSGVATLNASGKVVQDPANAQTIAADSKIPLADSNGKISNDWLKTGTGNGLDADTLDGQEGSYYLNRTNHTGTQLASTISNFADTAKLIKLNEFTAPDGNVSLNSNRLTNVADPLSGTDAANKNYVDSVSQGLDPKQSVKAATVANIVLSGTLNVDGVSCGVDTRVLVKNQTNKAENGIYLVKADAWVRASDTDTWAELISAYVFVEEGITNADSGWLCTVDAGGVLETNDVEWVQFSQAGNSDVENIGGGAINVFKQKNGSFLQFRSLNDSNSIDVKVTSDVITFDVLPENIEIDDFKATDPLSVAKGGTGGATAAAAKTSLGFTTKYITTIGDGVAKTFTITHNLNSRDVVAQVRESGSPFAVVEPDIEMTTTDSITVRFNNTPTSGQYAITVIG